MDPLQPIAIHGAPRSGTSWLGQVFNSHPQVQYRYQPLFSYAFKNRVGPRSSRQEFLDFFADLVATEDDFVLQRGKAALAGYQMSFPKVTPTHLVYKEVRYHDILDRLLDEVPEARLVAIVRDPRDVIGSWVKAPREFQAEWDIAGEWRDAPSKNAGREENWYGFSRWKELAHLFDRLAGKHPRRVVIVRYEELLAEPLERVASLFSACGLQMPASTREFLAESRQRDDGAPYGVFRKAGQEASRLHLPGEVAAEIVKELSGTPLARYLWDGPA